MNIFKRAKSWLNKPHYKSDKKLNLHLKQLNGMIELLFKDGKCFLITNGTNYFEKNYTLDKLKRPSFIEGLGELRGWNDDGSCYLGAIKMEKTE